MGSFAASTRRLVVIAGLVTLTVPATAAAGLAASSRVSTARSAAVASGGSYQALAPSRILDTGSGIGAPKAAVKAHATLALSVLGHGGVPSSGVGAVVLNVTAASPTASGYVTVYPAGAARPGTSNLNFTAGTAVANLVVVKVGSGGLVDLNNGSAGTLRLVADVEGYYAAGAAATPGAFTPLTPARVLDTGAGVGATKRPVPAHATVTLSALGHGGLPSTGVGAVVLNVTVASPTSAGYLTVFPSGDPRPTASNLNFVGAQVVPNLVVVKVGSAGQVSLYNSSGGTVRLVADVEGYYLSGDPTEPGALAPLSPARVLDTSAGIGATAGLVAPQATVAVSVLGHGGIPASGVGAVVLNLTAASPAASGYLTAYPAGGSRPGTSNLNFVHSATRANLVVVPVGAGGAVELFNGSGGKVRLIADIEGYFLTTPPASLTWAEQIADPQRGNLTSLSCPTIHRCVAVDGYGNALVDNDGVWTQPVRLSTAGGFTSVSCPLATFCVGVAAHSAMTFDGTSWSAPTAIDSSDFLQRVSCPTTTFCAAVDGSGQAMTYNGSAWSAPVASDTSVLISLSCASATRCVALDLNGMVTRWNGTSWHAPQDVFGSGSNVGSVDCPTSTACIALRPNDFATLSGNTWSPPQTILNGGVDLACTSASACISVDGASGTTRTFDGTSWTDVTPPAAFNPRAIACVSSTYCVAVGALPGYNTANSAATFDGTVWSAPNVVDTYSSGHLRAVSCPTTTFCAAVDEEGQATTFNGNSWSDPVLVSADLNITADYFTGVSCPTSTFCLAVASDGETTVFDGTNWSAPTRAPGFGFQAVSCPSSTFCMAIDNSSHAQAFTNGAWGQPVQIDPGANDLADISCPTSAHCVVVDGNGRAVTYDGVTWSSTLIDPQSDYLTSVSCPSATDCTAVNGVGEVIQLVGTTWQAPAAADPGGYLRHISCVGPATCQTIDLHGQAVPVTNGMAGQPTQIALPNQPESVSCATASYCVAVDAQGRAYVGQ